MKNILFIYLIDRTADTVYWAFFNEAGEKTLSDTPCALADCPKADFHTAIMVIFPAENMLFTTVSLPPAKPSHQALAALYALEEKLAEEVTELHALVFNPRSLGLFSVGIIRKALLEEWLQKLQAAEIRPHFLLPDIFLIPYQEDHWSALFFGTRVLVRTGLSQGFATAENHYALLLNKQEHPDILAFTPQTPADFLDIFLKEVTEKTFKNPLFTQFNLLQGKYRQTTPWHALKKSWRMPLLLAALWLVLLIIFTVSKYLWLTAESTKLTAQIKTLYMQAYPEASAVISPQLRISHEITQLKSRQENQSALELIAMAGNVLKQFSAITIETLNFRDGELRLEVQAPNFQILEQSVKLLQKSPLQVTQSNAVSEGKNIKATLSLKMLKKIEGE